MIDSSLFRFRTPVLMRWSDCDMLAHINNAVYLTYAEQSRTEYCNNLGWDWQEDGIILAKVEIEFKNPLLYTDKPFIYTRVSRLGNKSFDMETLILNEKNEQPKIVAIIRSVLVMWHYKTNITFPISSELRAKIIDFEGKEL